MTDKCGISLSIFFDDMSSEDGLRLGRSSDFVYECKNILELVKHTIYRHLKKVEVISKPINIKNILELDWTLRSQLFSVINDN